MTVAAIILELIIGTLLVFTAFGIACAVIRGLRRRPQAHLYNRLSAGVPGFTAEQLRLITQQRTPAEREAQRRSFVYGNSSLANPLITRAVVDSAAQSAGLALRPDATGGFSSIPSVRVAGRTSFEVQDGQR